jgi:hypothetical protein
MLTTPFGAILLLPGRVGNVSLLLNLISELSEKNKKKASPMPRVAIFAILALLYDPAWVTFACRQP